MKTLNNCNKIEISKNLSKKKGYSILFSQKLVDELIDILKDQIKKDGLNLKNIGSFKIVNKNERVGRNPKTGESFIIKSRKSIIFKPSKKILETLND